MRFFEALALIVILFWVLALTWVVYAGLREAYFEPVAARGLLVPVVGNGGQ